ncbi:hypothetical protein EVAR_8772_1 [Eumeta japonica]|uniref:Uncharacterized protein n=1 Tax=Eumeta variegata TaxID=151549 RepID=A0A4C1TTR2_EUMVA|nr:hypothetical protein EVAR_8772_1 [Eumeta japonica]
MQRKPKKLLGQTVPTRPRMARSFRSLARGEQAHLQNKIYNKIHKPLKPRVQSLTARGRAVSRRLIHTLTTDVRRVRALDLNVSIVLLRAWIVPVSIIQKYSPALLAGPLYAAKSGHV